MTTTEQQKATALKQLENLQAELVSAGQELSIWKDHDMHREDGSGAQDRRHEETGEWLRERLREASEKVAAQKKLMSS